MKESMWGYLIVILGVVIIGILLFVQRLTTTNEEDYYLSREVLKSAMLDAVDYGSYMNTHKLVMSREKFVAIFTRRFADSVTADKDYRIDFYDIYEYPPKATIRISTDTGETSINNDGINLEINTFITGILETTDDDGLFSTFYSVDADVDNSNVTDINDSRTLLAWARDGKTTLEVGTKADINGDGKIDYIDASIVERSILSRFKQGDVNMDGVINLEDVNLLKSGATLRREEKILADVNCDGKYNNEDYNILKNFVDGNISTLIDSYVKGDINGDGRVTALDVEYLYSYLNNKSTLTEKQLKRANINGDNKVNKDDLKELVDWLISGKYSYK